MLKEATAIVADRRVPEIAALPSEAGRDGVFAWAEGPPTAGQQAVLAYNKAHGPLRSVYGSHLCRCQHFALVLWTSVTP